MKLKVIICLIKGHDIDIDESIVSETMPDKRNWLCRCKRCGYYLMHDGAGSGLTILLNKKEAYQIKNTFEEEVAMISNLRYSKKIDEAEE